MISDYYVQCVALLCIKAWLVASEHAVQVFYTAGMFLSSTHHSACITIKKFDTGIWQCMLCWSQTNECCLVKVHGEHLAEISYAVSVMQAEYVLMPQVMLWYTAVPSYTLHIVIWNHSLPKSSFCEQIFTLCWTTYSDILPKAVQLYCNNASQNSLQIW